MFGLDVLIKIVTFIPSAVRLVEKLFGDKSGDEKHDAAIDILDGVLPILGVEDVNASAELTTGISLVIKGIVMILHAIGEFRHKSEEG